MTTPAPERSALLRRHLALLAPGTPLREGLDRIVHGRTGALVVLGSGPEVEAVSSGGFPLDVQFTPTALRELAKMDGGIVLSSDFERIIAAGVHFVPDGSLPTVETGTRHRSADRVARQTGVPVVTVSASMSTIALYLDGERHQVERPEQVLSRANQALATLERYRTRLSQATRALSAQEVHDQVCVRDVVQVAQRLEMVRRLEGELRGCVAALGVEGRLLEMQLHELVLGVDDLATLLELDYRPVDCDESSVRVALLAQMDSTQLVEPEAALQALRPPEGVHLGTRLTPRGYRQLAHLARIPAPLGRRVVEHFGSLQALFGARTADLLEVEGLGEARARIVREGLARVAESAYEQLD